MDLRRRQVPPAAGGKRAQLKRAFADAHKARDLESAGSAHFPDLAVPPLADGDEQHGPAGDERFYLHTVRKDGAAVYVDLRAQALGREANILALHPRAVGLFEVVRRVHEGICKIPVVRHYQQPLGIHVQPANGVDPPEAADKLRHIMAALFVAHGGDVCLGLIEHYV